MCQRKKDKKIWDSGISVSDDSICYIFGSWPQTTNYFVLCMTAVIFRAVLDLILRSLRLHYAALCQSNYPPPHDSARVSRAFALPPPELSASVHRAISLECV